MKNFLKKNGNWFYPASIPLICILFFLPFYLQGRTFIGRDMAVLGIPILSFVHLMGKAGKIYLWNPYISMGLPVWASSLGSCFYVFNAFFLIFEPIKNILSYFILHQIMAGLSAYFYLRNIKFTRPASLVGALLFAFSATRIYYMHNIERYAILTFTPLIFLLLDRLIEKCSVKSAVLFGIVFGLLVSSGGMQILSIYTPVFFLYGILRAYTAKKLFRIKTVALVLLIGVITGGIASILILPMMELNTQHPFRSAPLVYEQATAGSLAPWNTLLIPFANFMGDAETVLRRTGVSPWEHSYFLGFTGIALTLLAFVFPRKRRKRQLFFFLAMMVVGFLLALGSNNPVYPFLHKNIYFFSHFRNPSRFLAVTPIFMMFVSAAGIDNLRLFLFKRNLIPEKLITLCRMVFTVFLIFGIIYFFLYMALGNKTISNLILYLLSFALPSVLLGFASMKNRLPQKRYTIAYIFLFAAVMLAMAEPLIFVEKAYLDKPDFFRQELSFLNNIKQQIPIPYPRVFYAGNPNSASVVGLCNTCGYFPLDMENYTDYIYATFTGKRIDEAAFSRLVHFTFHPVTLLLEAAGKEASDGSNPLASGVEWKRVYFQRLAGNPMFRMLCPAFTILPDSYYPQQNYLGRFWFSRGYRVIKDRNESIEALMKPDFDPLDKVIIPEEPEPYNENMAKECKSTGKAIITFYSPDEIHVAMDGQWGWLTMSDRFYPGWRTLVDRKPATQYRGNYMFRTVFIPPGSGYLFLCYDPPVFNKGFTIYVITILFSFMVYIIMSLIEQRNRLFSFFSW